MPDEVIRATAAAPTVVAGSAAEPVHRKRRVRVGPLLAAALLLATGLPASADAEPFPAAPSESGSGCKDLAIVGARGSGEEFDDQYDGLGRVSGIYADRSAQLLFEADVDLDIERRAMDYEAKPVTYLFGVDRLSSYLNSAETGGTSLSVELNLLADACPDTLVIVTGYSQGAMVAHRGLQRTVADVTRSLPSQIVAVDLFANPLRRGDSPTAGHGTASSDHDGLLLSDPAYADDRGVPETVTDVTRDWCLRGDDVCALSRPRLRDTVQLRIVGRIPVGNVNPFQPFTRSVAIHQTDYLGDELTSDAAELAVEAILDALPDDEPQPEPDDPDQVPDPGPDWSVAERPDLPVRGTVWDLAAHGDGLLVGGSVWQVPVSDWSSEVPGLFRVDTDGDLDTDFEAELPERAWIESLHVRDDGRIVLAWTTFDDDLQPVVGVARMEVDGTTDPGFDSPTFGGDPARVSEVVGLEDGRLVVRGRFDQVDELPRPGLVRLHPDGAVDETFVPDELVAQVEAVAVLDNGRLLVSGSFEDAFGPWQGLAILDSEGALVERHEVQGIVNGEVSDLHAVDDGYILTGIFGLDDGTSRHGVIRVGDDGQLDTSAPEIVLDEGRVLTSVLEPDGSLVLGGSFAAINGQLRESLAVVAPSGDLDPDIGDPAVRRPGHCCGATVQAILPVGSDELGYLIGGSFSKVAGEERENLARVVPPVAPITVP